MALFDNIPIEYLLQGNWEQLSDAERIQILQQFDTNISKVQNRDPRKIIYDPREGTVFGEYLYDYPDRLFMYKIDNPVGALVGIIHEGTHALVDDAVLGKKDHINLSCAVNPDDLIQILSAKDIIYSYFNDPTNGDSIKQFNLCYFEEQIAYYESYIHLIEGIMEISGNNDLKIQILNGVLLEASYYYTERELLERVLGSYEDSEALLPYENHTQAFKEVEDFKISRLDRSGAEKYLKYMINQTRNHNGYGGEMDIVPSCSDISVAIIKAAKRRENEYIIETDDVMDALGIEPGGNKEASHDDDDGEYHPE